MKIAFDIGSRNLYPTTGISNYTFSLIKNLLSLNKQNYYSGLSFSPIKFTNSILGDNPLYKQIPIIKSYRLPSKMFHKVFGIWQTLNWPPVEWLTGKIDIFHSFDWYCPPSNNAKIVATIFDTTPITHPEWHTPGNVAQHLKRLEAVKKNASYITTISECSKRDIIKHLGIDQDKITVAYPGVDTKKFSRLNNEVIARVLKKFGLKPGFILFVSTISPRKNASRLIEAYKILSRKKDLPPLVMVGRRGKDSDKLTQSPNIFYLDYVKENELVALYNAAQVFVYPSLYEGFGIPILEAMACGCPVVTSNISSMPEVVGKAGILVDPYNVKSISRGISQLINDPIMAEKMSKLGLERVKKFTWGNCAKKTLEVYENLCMS